MVQEVTQARKVWGKWAIKRTYSSNRDEGLVIGLLLSTVLNAWECFSRNSEGGPCNVPFNSDPVKKCSICKSSHTYCYIVTFTLAPPRAAYN